MNCFILNFPFPCRFSSKNSFHGTELNLLQDVRKIENLNFSFSEKNRNIFKKVHPKKKTYRKKSWVAVFGPGGGFLGVGTSELVVIGIVAWLVLGPKRLYQLARDIGKISGEIKSVAEEARQTFQQAIDVESGDLSNFSSTKNTESQNSSKEPIKPRLNDLDDLVNSEISTLEKKKKNN